MTPGPPLETPHCRGGQLITNQLGNLWLRANFAVLELTLAVRN